MQDDISSLLLDVMNRNTKKAVSDVSDPNVNTKTKINVYFLLQIVNKTFNDFN